MPIEGFDYTAFANDLSQQALQILQQQSAAAPDTLSDEDKNLIIETIKRFCLMAGEALSNDTQINMNAEQASLVTQFIGEWTFHKSIDLINSKIPRENHEPILQLIAANIFNTAKLALIKNMPQEQLISLVETKVTQIYNEELEKLVKRGVLTPEQGSQAANMSNLNDMVQKTHDAEKLKEMENASEGNGENTSSIDTRTLKFVALAVLFKYIGEERTQEILPAFSEEDVKHIENYMKMSDIENKVDPVIMLKTFEEIKKIIPKPDTLNITQILNRFHKKIRPVSPEILSNIALNERENVRELILDINFPAIEVFAPCVLTSVVKTIEEKINDN